MNSARHPCSFAETIGNPAFHIPDFELVASIAKKHGIAFIVDNTFAAAGYIAQPLKLGANIVVESATKFIGGHGAHIDAGAPSTPPVQAPRSAGLLSTAAASTGATAATRCSPVRRAFLDAFLKPTEPAPGYHGANLAEMLGSAAFIARTRIEGLRDIGLVPERRVMR